MKAPKVKVDFTPELEKVGITRNLDELGYPFIPLYKFAYQVGLGYKQKRLWRTDYNSAQSFVICGYKDKARQFLANYNLPVAPGGIADTQAEAAKLFKKLKLPLVVKPNHSIHGRGITTHVNTLAKLRRAYRSAREWSSRIVIEEFVPGFDHRVLVINDRIIYVTKKMPAGVVGNGKQAISKLITQENRLRRSRKKKLYPIVLDTETREILKKQGYAMSSVPPKGKRVSLRTNANVSTGGEGVDVTNKIHPKIAGICLKSVSLLGNFIAGVDIITPDITKPLPAKIIELNSRPGFITHPVNAKARDTYRIFCRELFPNKSAAWIPVRYRGKLINQPKKLLPLLDKIPTSVQQFEAIGNLRKVKITKPKDSVRDYLLNKKTTAVTI